MNSLNPHGETPPTPPAEGAPSQRRDTHGRTLDDAMLEDQARRQAEWEQRLRLAYRPFMICDALMTWPPLVTVLLMGGGLIISNVTRNDTSARLGVQLAVAHLIVLLIYVPARFTLLRWWMRWRLDEVKARARADGVAFTSDPLVDSDRQWFNPG